MAKKAAEKTPAQKATEAARAKLTTAEKANADKPTDATKKAMTDAQSALKECIKAENRERFVRVAGGRVKKARTALRNLANVASPRSYLYDASDVDKAEKALTAELTKTLTAMRNALTSGGGSKTPEDDFTF